MGFLEIVGLITLVGLAAVGASCMVIILIQQLLDGYERFRSWRWNRRYESAIKLVDRKKDDD